MRLKNTFQASDDLYSVYDGEDFKIVGKSKSGYNLIEFEDGQRIEAEENEIYDHE